MIDDEINKITIYEPRFTTLAVLSCIGLAPTAGVEPAATDSALFLRQLILYYQPPVAFLHRFRRCR